MLLIAFFTTGHNAADLKYQDVRSVADIELDKKGTCGSENLESEAKCSCYHASTKETMPEPLEEVCKKSFGNNLSALKDSCAPYMKNGNLDDSLKASLSKTINSCEGELPTEGEGSSRMVIQDSARFFPRIICIGWWWGWTLGWPFGWPGFRGWWYWWWIIRYHYYWYWRCFIVNIFSGFGGGIFGGASPLA